MKRMLTLALTVALAMSLVACGGSDNSDESPEWTPTRVEAGAGDIPSEPESPVDGPDIAEEQAKQDEENRDKEDSFESSIPVGDGIRLPVTTNGSEWRSAEDAPEDLPGEKDFLDKDSVRMSKLLGMEVTDEGFYIGEVEMRKAAGLKMAKAYIRDVDSQTSYLIPDGTVNLMDKYLLTVDSIENEEVDGGVRRSAYTFQYYVDKNGNVVDNRDDAYIIYQGNVTVSVEAADGFEGFCFYSYAAMQQAYEYGTILPIDTFRTFSAFKGSDSGIITEVKTEKWKSYSRQANMSRYVQDGGILQVYFFSQASTEKDATFEEIVAGGEKVLSEMENDIFTVYGLRDILTYTRVNPNPLAIDG